MYDKLNISFILIQITFNMNNSKRVPSIVRVTSVKTDSSPEVLSTHKNTCTSQLSCDYKGIILSH